MTFTEDQIRTFVAESIEQYGIEHTHDFECETWRGHNWVGACDCTLPTRERAGGVR